MPPHCNVGSRKRRIVMRAVISGTLVALVVIAAWDFVYRNCGIEFYAQKPYLIGWCVVLAVVASALVSAIFRTSLWGTSNSNGKRQPFRLVVLIWALLILLFVAMAPVVDESWLAYLFSGSIYSFFLAVVSVGLALLGKNGVKRTVLFVAGVILLACVSFAVFLAVPLPLQIVGLLLRTIECTMGLFIVGVVILSICGWIRYLQGKEVKLLCGNE
jgi:hypothetical protein